jgi:hypothetical protein
MNLHLYEKKVFSQNGEDGIIEYLIGLLYQNVYNKTYLEIGTESGVECNTRYLRENFQWNGVMIDGGHQNESINLFKYFVNKENIIDILQTLNVPKKLELLSIDIDSTDFYVLHEILKHYESDIIVCEYNVALGPDEDKVVVYDSQLSWNGSNYYGASLLSFTKLCNLFDYSLVGTDSRGVNAFFVSRKKLKELNINDSNIDDVSSLYSPGKFGPGPYGGWGNDGGGRSYTTFNEIFKLK